MRIGRFMRWLTGTVLGVVALAASTGIAAEGPNTGKVSFSIGNDITTAYFFRGILQERNGFIDQPYGEINFSLLSRDDDDERLLTGITLIAGMWNSIQTEKTLADSDSGPSNWYEADLYAGLKYTLCHNLDLKALYIAYTYPNGAFDTVQEFDFVASLNDSEWLDKFALYPSITWAAELDNTALGKDRGYYMQFDVRPSMTLIDDEDYPLTAALPLQVGVSLGDYYEIGNDTDNAFGFFKGGPVLSVPLAFIPTDYGSWSASAGVAVYALGTNLTKLNDNDNPWVVGTWSVNWTY